LPKVEHENVLVGTSHADDAGVYKLTDDIAIIQTIDIFTPLVDDPYKFGQIAAANAISDVYAMGGKPLTALNFIGYPKKYLDIDTVIEILKGGADKAKEADTIILGGHSIMDPEVKYGLAVTGIVHPDKIITNAEAKPGDKLILTKPIGTGILSTAIKFGKASADVEGRICDCMTTLNRKPSEIMQEFGVNSCTDITGYGLLGHAHAMASASGVSMEIQLSQVPLLKDTLEYCNSGNIPGGSYTNKEYLEDKIWFDNELTETEQLVLYDPQTSGGLLISVQEEKADEFLTRLLEADVQDSSIVGAVTSANAGQIDVRK
jgi:selenide,water dikinase